jgi:hypothetical protein
MFQMSLEDIDRLFARMLFRRELQNSNFHWLTEKQLLLRSNTGAFVVLFCTNMLPDVTEVRDFYRRFEAALDLDDCMFVPEIFLALDEEKPTVNDVDGWIKLIRRSYHFNPNIDKTTYHVRPNFDITK